MKPYYQDNAVTIYHGDCREILPELEPVDLVLTDPPYGIANVWKGGNGHGWQDADLQKDLRNSPSSPAAPRLTSKVQPRSAQQGIALTTWGLHGDCRRLSQKLALF